MEISTASPYSVLKSIASIQNTLVGIQTDGKNPHFKNTYVTLNNLLLTLRPHLQKHGLILMQTATVIEGKNVLLCRIMELETGEWIQGAFELIAKSNDPQQLGSAISYMRRYSIVTMFGLLTVDDDAELASGRQPEVKDKTPVDTTPRLSSDRAEAMALELEKMGYARLSHIALVEKVTGRKVQDLAQLSEAEALEIWSYAKRAAGGQA